MVVRGSNTKRCIDKKIHPIVDSVVQNNTKRRALLVKERRIASYLAGLALTILTGTASLPVAQAQQSAPASATAKVVAASGEADQEFGSSWSKAPFATFIDARTRQTAPDPKLIEKGLRILTSDGFAPFNSLDRQGRPQGYHVDLSKLICEELVMACTIKVVDFETIPDLLAKGEADIALAGLSSHPTLLDKVGFSLPFLQRPARFVSLKTKPIRIGPLALKSKPIAVVGRSAHEAYLKTYFSEAKPIAVADLADANTLLVDGKVDAIFADGMHLSQLISNNNKQLTFKGEPYLDQHFFGPGMAIAYQREQQGLRGLLDYVLVRLAKKGRLTELYARHFPLDIYARY
jgi:polar amino acid transport system substrate-binding protein